MKTKKLFIYPYLLLLLISPSFARATILTGPITNSANQHLYFLLDTNTWTLSELEAESVGGHLVTINDQLEHDWVYATFSSFGGLARHLWIGLYRTNTPDAFAWVNGEPLVFSAWAPGEPNNCDLIEDRGMIFSPDFSVASLWNDVSDSGFGGCGGGQLNIYAVVEVNAGVSPSIAVQPADTVVFAGVDATLAVLASGTPPFSYQWIHNGTNVLQNATNKTLIITNIAYSQAGSYSVQVINGYGSTNSAGAILTVLTPPPCVPHPLGIVSWWRAEGNASDHLGINSGILQNGVSFGSTTGGRAFVFDGINDFVEIPRSPSLDITNQLTIEFWVKIPTNNPMNSVQGLVTSDYYGIVISPGQSSQYGINFALSTNDGTSFRFTSDGNGGPALISLNTWHHVGATYDGTKMQLYIDGQPWSNSVALTGTISSMLPTSFVAIGSESGRSSCPGCASSRFFNGWIDDVTIYNKALSPFEIAAIYNAGGVGKCTLPTGPAFFVQPTNSSTVLGSNALFAAIAGGTPPLRYQWRFNGNNIANATNSTLLLTNVQLSKRGAYSVRVTNGLDSVTSSNAVLDVVALFAFGNGLPLTNSAYNFAGAPTIQLQTLLTNGSMFYTLDGSQPSFASTAYSAPFVVTSNSILRLLGYSADFSEFTELGPIYVLLPPVYTLSAATAGGGSVTFNPPGGSYFSNTVISVTATQFSGWTFLYWLGDLAGSNNPANITLTRNKQVQAVFGTALGTTASGGGSVTKIPDSLLYPFGSVVRLVPVPQVGNYFGVWGNAASGNANPLNFTVTNANQTVSSLFAPLGGGQAALTVIPNGFGHVTASPQASVYATGAGVTLTAVPDAGQSFTGWSGDAGGSANPLNLTMTTSKVITANFSTWPRLTAIPPDGLLKDGFRFTLYGEYNRNYQIDVTTNIPNWVPLTTLTNYYNQVQYLDTAATNKPIRLYRALRLP